MRRGLVGKTVARSKLVAEGLAVGTEAVATARAVAAMAVEEGSAALRAEAATARVEAAMAKRSLRTHRSLPRSTST